MKSIKIIKLVIFITLLSSPSIITSYSMKANHIFCKNMMDEEDFFDDFDTFNLDNW